MPIFILSLIIQILFVIHVLKTGRNTIWIYVVMLLPLAGIIAYFFMELLPDLMAGKTGHRVQRNIGNTINPNRDINHASNEYSITDTAENSANLAEECINKGRYDEAKQLYEKALKGIHEYDSGMMHGLAQSEYGLGNYNETKAVLDKLIIENPDFKNHEAHLLYAKALEKLQEFDQAEEEYEVLHGTFPGPEASYRYAMLLKQQGSEALANSVLEEIMHKARTAGKHYNSRYKEWINKARIELG